MQKQKPRNNPYNEKRRSSQIRQRERILLEKLITPKQLRMFLGRTRQGATESRTEDTPHGPHERHDAERARLQFPLGNEFRNHGSQDTDVAVHEALHGAGDDQHAQRLGEAKDQGEDHGEGETEQDDGFAADSVGDSTPDYGHGGLAA